MSAGRLSRHANINDIIKRACDVSLVPATLEPIGLLRDDKQKRPDGLTRIPWSKGKCLVWDATCVDTLANSYVASSSRSAGAAAKIAETKKRSKYSLLMTQYKFCAFAVETLGTFGEEAIELVNELGRRLRAATGEIRSRLYLTQRISIAIQRGNSASVLATLPPSAKFDEIFLL